jgi:hypothetical protein
MASVFVMVSLPLTVCDLDRCLQGAAWVAYLSEGLEGGAHHRHKQNKSVLADPLSWVLS